MYHLEVTDHYWVLYYTCKTVFPNTNERYLGWFRCGFGLFCLPKNCPRYISLAFPLFKKLFLEEYWFHTFPAPFYEMFEKFGYLQLFYWKASTVSSLSNLFLFLLLGMLSLAREVIWPLAERKVTNRRLYARMCTLTGRGTRLKSLRIVFAIYTK